MTPPWHAGDPFAAMQWQGDADPVAQEFVAAIWDALGSISPAGIATAWLNAQGIFKQEVRGAIPPPPPSLPGPPTPQQPAPLTFIPEDRLAALAAQWLTERGFLDRVTQALESVLPLIWARAWQAGVLRAEGYADEAEDRDRKGRRRKRKHRKPRKQSRRQVESPSPGGTPRQQPPLTPQQQLAALMANPAFAAWLSSMLGPTVALITGSLLRRVAALLAAAAIAGWAISRLAAALEQAFLVRWRAEMIAATEASRAQTAGMVAVYQALGVKWVRWVTRNDGLVCPRCKKNQAQGTVRLGKKFSSGDRWPPAHPRCRCVLAPSSLPRKLVGKSAGPLPGSAPADAGEVFEQLLEHYPAESISWVHDMPWVRADVPQDLIDYDDVKKWNAWHQPNRVAEFARRIQGGEDVSRPVMVDEPGAEKVVVIDGHHHALAFRKLGRPVPAYVGMARQDNGPWLETHSSQFHAAGAGDSGYQRQDLPKGDKPRASGIMVRAEDTGRVLMLQRHLKDGKDASGKWEFPGGRLDDGEGVLEAAIREWCEETGCAFPDGGKLTGTWSSGDGKYRGYVLAIPREEDVDIENGRDVVENPDSPGSRREPLAWFDMNDLKKNPAVRDEIRDGIKEIRSAAKDRKLSKEEVNYREASEAGRSCGTCSMIRLLPPDFESAHCTLVEGMICPDDVCDRWESAAAVKTAETPYLSTHHAPIGTHGLWHTPSKKVPERQQLPAYIQNIRNALMRDGHDESSATAMAVAAVKRWAEGKLGWGRRKITPEVRAAAAAAVREWEELKATHH